MAENKETLELMERVDELKYIFRFDPPDGWRMTPNDSAFIELINERLNYIYQLLDDVDMAIEFWYGDGASKQKLGIIYEVVETSGENDQMFNQEQSNLAENIAGILMFIAVLIISGVFIYIIINIQVLVTDVYL